MKLPKAGRVWHRFQRQRLRTGDQRTFLVQEVVESMYDDFVKFLENNYFLGSDLFAKAAMETDCDTMKKYRKFWKEKVLPENLSVICIEDIETHSTAEPNIVGAQIHQRLQTNIDPKFQQTQMSPLPDLVIKARQIVNSKYDLYKTYRVDEYLKVVGLCVKRGYAELNITEGMLKASEEICKANGLQLMTVDSMSPSFQTSASSSGFRSLCLTDLEHIGNVMQYKFPENIQNIRVMAKFVR